ncbi:hypothetical protein RSAG8_03089, partial [Rhizoctonia solani AG-8 WAC10335]
MKISALLAVTLLASSASASWFSSEPDTPYEYTKWNQAQLEQWLKDHNVQAPQGASQKQLKDLVQENWNSAQTWSEARVNQASKALTDIKDWDESQLRSFLVDQGIVAPSGPKEKLVVSAKQYYRSYASAASSLSAAASATASTAVYGDHGYQASKSASSASRSASSVAASSSARAAKALEDSKDYVYSSWSDSDLRAYLEKHGVVKTQAQLTREQLLAQMLKSMREKLQKLVKDNYLSAKDTAWHGWSDSEMRQWLIDNGYLRSDAQVKRDELVNLMNRKYNAANAKTADYLTWPDARLRAYLRAQGVDESKIPPTRPGLLHETRVRWVQTTNAVENWMHNIKNTVNGGVEWTEEKLSAILNILGGHKQAAERKANEAGHYANQKADQATFAAQSLTAEAGKKTASAKAEL